MADSRAFPLGLSDADVRLLSDIAARLKPHGRVNFYELDFDATGAMAHADAMMLEDLVRKCYRIASSAINPMPLEKRLDELEAAVADEAQGAVTDSYDEARWSARVLRVSRAREAIVAIFKAHNPPSSAAARADGGEA